MQNGESIKRMTNGDKIRQKFSTMKDEELQEEFADYICRHVPGDVCTRAQYCYECRMEWLKQEAEQDDS